MQAACPHEHRERAGPIVVLACSPRTVRGNTCSGGYGCAAALKSVTFTLRDLNNLKCLKK